MNKRYDENPAGTMTELARIHGIAHSAQDCADLCAWAARAEAMIEEQVKRGPHEWRISGGAESFPPVARTGATLWLIGQVFEHARH